MVEYHKHKGVESMGKLKSHLVTQQHKDATAKRYHTLELKKNSKLIKTSTKKKVSDVKDFFNKNKEHKEVKSMFVENKEEKIKYVQLPVDKEGYISLNVDKCGKKGVRLTFTKDEGRHKKTVALQIDNNPSIRGGSCGNEIKHIRY